MKVILLSAGRGERLRPLTDRVPKALTEVGGESLLARHLRRLAQCGFCDAVINVAHLGAQIRTAIQDGAEFGMRVRYSEESPALETAGGIRLAIARNLLPQNAPFLSVNADIVCDINFAALRMDSKMNCHLVLTKNPPANPRGDFSLSADGTLLQPGTDALTYSGVGVFHPGMFAEIAPGESAKLFPLLQKAIGDKTATGEIHEGVWHDTGTPASLAAARAAVSDGEK
ncbi:MAG: nucleotidyltransferase family protein [Gammaproteobacteria bacterium]